MPLSPVSTENVAKSYGLVVDKSKKTGIAAPSLALSKSMSTVFVPGGHMAGTRVGENVGLSVGLHVGCRVGATVGGGVVGAAVGPAVG